MPLTAQGKTAALDGLRQRRLQYKAPTWPANDTLPAGAPMTYACIACGAPIVMPEGWVSKPDVCGECSALLKLGWLTE